MSMMHYGQVRMGPCCENRGPCCRCVAVWCDCALTFGDEGRAEIHRGARGEGILAMGIKGCAVDVSWNSVKPLIPRANKAEL